MPPQRQPDSHPDSPPREPDYPFTHPEDRPDETPVEQPPVEPSRQPDEPPWTPERGHGGIPSGKSGNVPGRFMPRAAGISHRLAGGENADPFQA